MWDWERVMPTLGRGGGAGASRGFAALNQVRAYWDGLRGSDLLPRRDAIEPQGLGSALEHVFLLERIAPGIARFRLAGSHLTHLMGMEVRGMPLTALLNPIARDGARLLIEAVFTGPSIVELALDSERSLGRPVLRGRMLLLPVNGDQGFCDRALGCLVAEGEIGRSPRRFGITRQRTEPVIARPAPARCPAAAHFCRGWQALHRAAPQATHPPAPLSASGEGRRIAKGRHRSAAPLPRVAPRHSAMRRAFSRSPESSSATRNASSSDWLAFRRGSQAVW
jgi:hypothetical protein